MTSPGVPGQDRAASWQWGWSVLDGCSTRRLLPQSQYAEKYKHSSLTVDCPGRLNDQTQATARQVCSKWVWTLSKDCETIQRLPNPKPIGLASIERVTVLYKQQLYFTS